MKESDVDYVFDNVGSYSTSGLYSLPVSEEVRERAEKTLAEFEEQDRGGMIADIKSVIPHIQDSDMVGLSKQVLEKLEAAE